MISTTTVVAFCYTASAAADLVGLGDEQIMGLLVLDQVDCLLFALFLQGQGCSSHWQAWAARSAGASA